MKKQFKLYIFIIYILLLGTITLKAQEDLTQQAEVPSQQVNPQQRFFEIQKNLDIFATLFKEVNMYYVDEINPNKLMKTAIDAMLNSLDPYTDYIPEDRIEDYRTLTTGRYGGIGALIGARNGKTIVLMPYETYPAQEAGLKIGDQILKIDGISLEDKSSDDVSKLLKGQANTKVRLEIKSYGNIESSEVEVMRANIKIDNVPYYGMLNKEVGYFQLTDFTQTASKEVREAVEMLKKQGATKLILDLRSNPGGLLREAINIANIFIPRGSEVVSTRGKIKDWNKTYRALNEPMDTDIPLIVLTDNRSASASEIVSGVIQDYDRGVLIGQNSFGKGLVQATRPLSYNSQLKVTTAKYYIPSGRCIQALDYSNRSQDGKVSKVPDSLKTIFKTNKGRTFYDGEGLEPDIKIDVPSRSSITKSLLEKNLIFEYANYYATQRERIPSAQTFRLKEEEYQSFVRWLKGKDYDYITDVEKTLQMLKEKAKEEKYYDAIQTQIKSLEAKIGHNKEVDLQTFKEEIKALLEVEIAARYFLERGRIEASFNHDTEIKAALELFKDMDRYSKILASSK